MAANVFTFKQIESREVRTNDGSRYPYLAFAVYGRSRRIGEFVVRLERTTIGKGEREDVSIVFRSRLTVKE